MTISMMATGRNSPTGPSRSLALDWPLRHVDGARVALAPSRSDAIRQRHHALDAGEPT
jgi:hypothetical protein